MSADPMHMIDVHIRYNGIIINHLTYNCTMMKNATLLRLKSGWMFAALLFLSGWNAQATHIVGGSLTYKCLGGDLYEIVLTVQGDCALGQNTYDSPAWVGVFDHTGQIVDTVFLSLTGKIDTIARMDPCMDPGSDICLRVIRYTERVALPPISGGYYLSYQRCCRTGAVQNIPNPLQVGSTYWFHIPEQALTGCKSAPIWKEETPVFVAVNEPLLIDHSALDPNGDSLAYALIHTYDGGVAVVNPQPTPSSGPPYEEVPWLAPYSLENLMGGVPLTIDPVTGVMTGVPNTLGRFVVAVKVSAYRAGELIGETFRDFQLQVVPCNLVDIQDPVISSLDGPTLYPNPSTGEVLLQWPESAGTTDIRVFNAYGAAIGHYRFQAGETRRLDLRPIHPASGWVYLSIQSDDQAVPITRKVMLVD